MHSPPRRPFVLGLLFLASGCSSSEILVRVSAAEGEVLAPDAFRVEVYGPRDLGPAVRVRREVSGQLPQTFLLQVEDGSARRSLRVRVVALLGDEPIAAGDAVTRFEDDGRQELSVQLTPECERVACPALERCDPTTLRCDGACSLDGCDLLRLCTDDAKCDFGEENEFPGFCKPVEPYLDRPTDKDQDGFFLGTCPYVEPLRTGFDCDDRDCMVPAAGRPTCDGHRDGDCNGITDELEYCDPPCAVGTFDSLPDPIELDEQIVAVAGVRELRTNLPDSATEVCTTTGRDDVVLLATDRRVEVRALFGATISQVPLAGVRDIAWRGGFVAIATDEGLVSGWMDSTGALGLRTPPFDAGGTLRGMTAVALTEDRVWVSGEGYELAEVRVDRLDAPRLTALIEGDARDELVAGPGIEPGSALVCGLVRSRGEITCRDPDLPTSVRMLPIADARHVSLSSRADPPSLVVATDGAEPGLTVYSLDPAGTTFSAALPDPVVGLALLGDAVVHASESGVAHAGFASMDQLAGDAFTLPSAADPITDVAASVAGGVTYITLARGRSLWVVPRSCPP